MNAEYPIKPKTEHLIRPKENFKFPYIWELEFRAPWKTGPVSLVIGKDGKRVKPERKNKYLPHMGKKQVGRITAGHSSLGRRQLEAQERTIANTPAPAPSSPKDAQQDLPLL